MSTIGTEQCPLRVAIVGSGPSGFYAADALLKSTVPVRIGMFERLPAPFGLVRYGVAPDHQKIKSATRVYEKIAQHEHFTFFGNVEIGRDLSIDELQSHYHAVILAYGAETDRALDIPGIALPGSYTATEFVAWYNGHPAFQDRVFDLSNDTAVVIGHGNVAVDVCRILAKTVDELAKTDITRHALEVLAESQITDIFMIGRRGPVQAKFTHLELKELGRLADCAALVDPSDLVLSDADAVELEDPGNANAAKILPLLKEFAEHPRTDTRRRLHIKFLLSPVNVLGNEHVQSVVLERNRLEGEPLAQRAQGTGETLPLECGILLRSVGYNGAAILGVPFDDRSGTVPNLAGRVIADGKHVPGLYAVGWIKRGPTGVIGTNKPDSVETVEALLADLDSLPPCPEHDGDRIIALLEGRKIRVVSFEDWRRIDQIEVERGRKFEKPREKIIDVAGMLRVIESSDSHQENRS